MTSAPVTPKFAEDLARQVDELVVQSLVDVARGPAEPSLTYNAKPSFSVLVRQAVLRALGCSCWVHADPATTYPVNPGCQLHSQPRHDSVTGLVQGPAGADG